jgi:dTDP-4-dehydrorhamnose 3,5-epimerase
MIFTETVIPGAFIIEPERHEDHRGFFARTWCENEAKAHGLTARFVQCSVSYNLRRGTLRGLHYQMPPFEEAKLIRCTMGAIFDVAVDLRRNSPGFRRWAAATLTSDNRRMLYVPEGCAHGLQTLEDNTEVLYQISQFHSPEHARGVRWNDPAFGIEWPTAGRTMIERDRDYPDFTI